jgi:hypothetical protein
MLVIQGVSHVLVHVLTMSPVRTAAPRPRSLLRSYLAARSLIWKYVVKGVWRGRMWVGSAARGRGQDVATVITLICAGQQSRCRMTVSRHRAIHPTSRTWVETTSERTRVLGISASPDHELRCPPETIMRRWAPPGARARRPRRSPPVRARLPSAPSVHRCAGSDGDSGYAVGAEHARRAQ